MVGFLMPLTARAAVDLTASIFNYAVGVRSFTPNKDGSAGTDHKQVIGPLSV